MATKKTATAIEAKKDEGMVAFDYGDDAGAGQEDVGVEHLMVPFLSLLQTNSPQCEDEASGMRAGEIFNSVTETASKEAVYGTPVKIEHTFVEWVPRESGGGFVGRHEPQSEIVQNAKASAEDFGRYSTNGNDLVETFYLYLSVEEAGRPTDVAIVAFTSSKIKHYKRWMTQIMKFSRKVPLFGHRVKLSPSKEKNKHGSFYTFSVDPAEGEVKKSLLAPDDERFLAAKKLREMLSTGAAAADFSKEKTTNGDAATEDFDKF